MSSNSHKGHNWESLSSCYYAGCRAYSLLVEVDVPLPGVPSGERKSNRLYRREEGLTWKLVFYSSTATATLGQSLVLLKSLWRKCSPSREKQETIRHSYIIYIRCFGFTCCFWRQEDNTGSQTFDCSNIPFPLSDPSLKMLQIIYLEWIT